MTGKYQIKLLVVFALFVCVPAGFAERGDLTAVRQLSLKESLDLAVSNSSSLKREQQKEKAAGLNSRNVELDWLPNLLVGAAYKYEGGGEEEEEQNSIDPFLTLSSVVLNNPQSYTKKVEAMNRSVSVKTAQIEILSDLYGKSIEKYFSLLQAQSNAQLMKAHLKELEEDFQRSADRAGKGLISELELMQNESLLEMAEIETEVEKDKVRVASFELAAEVGLDVDLLLEATDSFEATFYPIDFEKCKEFAKANHPMFKLNRVITDKLPGFRKNIGLISWPSLTVTGYLGSGAPESSSDSDYFVSLTLSKPLWDYGKTNRRQEMLSIELNNMEHNIESSEEMFYLQLKKLHSEYTNSARLLEKVAAFQELAEKINASTEKNYRMGLISYQDLLQAKKKEIERKIYYLSLSSKYLVAEMLLKLNCGVFDSALLLEHGPGWLEKSNGYTFPDMSP